MSVLPRTTPAAYIEQLQAALTAAGITYDGLEEGRRVTHGATDSHGVTWQLTYINPGPFWCLRGPNVWHGVGVTTEEAVQRITETVPEPAPAPAPVDPHPHAPRTHMGFEVPEFIRAAWADDLGQGWRLGVASAVGNLPDTRPRV